MLALWLAFSLAVPPHICPYCRLGGQMSTVRPVGWTTCTLLGVVGSYDEHGRWQEPLDVNRCATTEVCSRGHEWTYAYRQGDGQFIGYVR